MSTIMEYKRNFGNYRQLLAIRSFEICDSTNKLTHPYHAFFAQWILPPALVKACPLKGEYFRLDNLTYTPDAMSIWPDGYYRSRFGLSDDLDSGIFNWTTVMKITNTNNIDEFK